jgi:hypothetical protein
MLWRNFPRPIRELQKCGKLSEIIPDPWDILNENPRGAGGRGIDAALW